MKSGNEGEAKTADRVRAMQKRHLCVQPVLVVVVVVVDSPCYTQTRTEQKPGWPSLPPHVLGRYPRRERRTRLAFRFDANDEIMESAPLHFPPLPSPPLPPTNRSSALLPPLPSPPALSWPWAPSIRRPGSTSSGLAAGSRPRTSCRRTKPVSVCFSPLSATCHATACGEDLTT